MGAEYIERELPDLTIKELKSKFAEMQDEAAYENGHSYSGDINMAPGLDLKLEKVFNSYDEASDYLNGTVKKWENAIAVRFKYKDESKNEKIGILIGALCSS